LGVKTKPIRQATLPFEAGETRNFAGLCMLWARRRLGRAQEIPVAATSLVGESAPRPERRVA
jgi:hypothetical protein